MTSIMDHVVFLSQEIGPRPAGTEEEQQAALYIADQMHKDGGLPAVIEDFSGASSARTPWNICFGLTFAVGLLSLFLPVVAVPAIVVSLAMALMGVLEVLDRPFLSRFFRRGVSQNIVAKYDPNTYGVAAQTSRRRKVVLVARYDSGKVTAEYQGLLRGILPVLYRIFLGALLFTPLLLLVRTVFFLNAVGMVALVFNVLTIIVLVLVAFPLLLALLNKFAKYNEAANSNASGTAVLIELAKRLGRWEGSSVQSSTGLRGAPRIHGEEEAYAQGLVPDGARLSYETTGMGEGVSGTSGKIADPAASSPEDRLSVAKAAVAALSGRPVSVVSHQLDVAERLAQDAQAHPHEHEAPLSALMDETGVPLTTPVGDPAFTDGPIVAGAAVAGSGSVAVEAAVIGGGSAFEGAVAATPVGDPAAMTSEGDAPDWFRKARKKAKKSDVGRNVEIHRSRLSDALDAANAPLSPQASPQIVVDAVDAIGVAVGEAFAGGVPAVRLHPLSEDGREAQESQPTQTPRITQASQIAQASRTTQTPQAPRTTRPPRTQGVRQADSTAQTPQAPQAPQVPQAPQQADQAWPVASPTGVFVGRRSDVAKDSQDISDSEATSAISPIDTNVLKERRRRVAPPDLSAISTGEVLGENAFRPSLPRQPIRLPDIGLSGTSSLAQAESLKQRAPLAQAAESSTDAAKSLLTLLPSIEADVSTAAREPMSLDSFEDVMARRRGVPSLSQVTPQASQVSQAAPQAPQAPQAREQSRAFSSGQSLSPSVSGSFSMAGATGSFASVDEELIGATEPGDLYIHDADDSVFEEGFTETGAFAGPGYVDMPKSRARRFFDRFGGKKDKDEYDESAQEWLGVDDDFDARRAGAQRGGWESFREDAEGGAFSGGKDRWEGGAFSLRRKSGRESDRESGRKSDRENPAGSLDWNEDPRYSLRGREEAFSSVGRGFDDDLDKEIAHDFARDAGFFASEHESIQQFRYADIDTEVWLVALGSELANNSGMRAFVAEHEQELRGSIVVNLDALGAGTLSLIEKEGVFRAVEISTRMKRYVRKASDAQGVSIPGEKILWKNSPASYASSLGLQAMSLVGMKAGKPAYFAERGDVSDNMDVATLEQNLEFVMELIKSI